MSNKTIIVDRKTIQLALEALEEVGVQDHIINFSFVNSVRDELRAILTETFGEVDEEVEQVAEELYMRFSRRSGYEPWVRCGSSLQQDECREEARRRLKALDADLARGTTNDQ